MINQDLTALNKAYSDQLTLTGAMDNYPSVNAYIQFTATVYEFECRNVTEVNETTGNYYHEQGGSATTFIVECNISPDELANDFFTYHAYAAKHRSNYIDFNAYNYLSFQM